jgi:hypothetical protein
MKRLVNAKNLARLAAVALVAAFSSDMLLAQVRPPSTGTATRRPIRPASAFCLRGGRFAQCRSFAIVEIPIAARLAHTLQSTSPGIGDAYFGLELGGMVNRDDSHAFGASIAGGVAAGESHLSVNVRTRTWFSGASYRDLSAGLLAMGTSGHATAYGLTARAGSGYLDLIGVWAGADVALIGGPPRASLHAGVRLGSYVAMSVVGLASALLGLSGGLQGGGT